eukprot:2726009-Prymnesium_polylepis.1
MERPALRSELARLPRPAPPFLVFAESRAQPLKSACALPERWARRGGPSLRERAALGEYWTFQLGVYASGAREVRVDDYRVAAAASNRSSAVDIGDGGPLEL